MRMPALEPIMQSKRVMLTISMMLRTPRPSSPTIQASAPRSSVSLEALDALPIFFFSRSTCNGFLVPSGPPARQQEARQAAGRLRQHQKGIAHGRRHKILVADQFVGLARARRVPSG